MRVLTLLRAELVKVFGQKGTYAGYAVLLVLVALVVWGSWRYGSPFDKSMRRDQDLLVAGKLVTGTTIARFMMEPSMFVLMPLLVCAVSGGLFAAEMQRGTMRAILCRPVRRTAVVIGKYLAGWIHAISVTLFLGLISLALGYAVFGRGELVTYYDGLTILTEPMALTRLAQGYAYCALCMCAVASLGMFFSQLVSNPLTASAVAVATSVTRRPASVAFAREELPSRSPTRTSTPDSFRLSACACPWEPYPRIATFRPAMIEESASFS